MDALAIASVRLLPEEVSRAILVLGGGGQRIAVWVCDRFLGCAVASLQPAPRFGQQPNEGRATWSRPHKRRNVVA